MHSYQHNIKTFNSATMHLTHVERSLYRCLIELYYDTEQPLPADDFDRLARRVMAVTEEEKAALAFVLGEFFEKTGDVYTHDYCDEVIERYQEAVSAKAKAGRASAEARKKKAAARKQQRRAANKQDLTGDEQVLNSVGAEGQQNPTNKKPETINHKPTTPPKSPKGGECELFRAFWLIYPRKTQKPQALKAWEKLKPSEDLADLILETIIARLEAGEWSADRKQFIPHPATYLNQRRWEDEIIPRQDAPQKPKPETGPEFLASRFDRSWAEGMRQSPSTPKTLPPGGTQ